MGYTAMSLAATMPATTIDATAVAPPPPRGVEWIGLEAAAQRSGWSVRHVRRLCGDEWHARGLARVERPPGGGKPAWLVREDAHASLARVKAPERLAFDVRQLPEARRRELLARRAILDGWERAKSAGVAAGRTERDVTFEYLRGVEIEHDLKLSRSRLYEWHNAYRADGLAGLVDRRWQPPREKRSADDPFFAELQRRYLDLRRPKLTVVHRDTRLIAERRGWTVHSYHAAKRFIATIPPGVLMKFRAGDKAYTDNGESFIERDYSTLASNDVWVGDHHQFDVVVDAGPRHGLVRPWLTAWMDMRSRRVVGWFIGAASPNQDTILLAFRHAIHPAQNDCGVPLRVYIDNGKDYDSYALHGRTKRDRFRRQRFRIDLDAGYVDGLFGELGVETTHCQPYHGQSKPIERFFGTLEDRFGRGFETYCGNAPGTRPQDLQKRLDRGQAPRLVDFAAAFVDWLRDDYHHRVHAGHAMDGRTPAQAYAENLGTKRTAPAELLDVLLQQKSKPVRVTQNGVRWHGILYGQHERSLWEKIGQQVYLRVDPRDVSRVSVWTLDNRFLCHAPANIRLSAKAGPSTREDLRAALADKRRRNRLASEYHQRRPTLHMDTSELLARETAARLKAEREASEPPPAPNVAPVQTAIDDQMPALRRAVERDTLRMAAGAESQTATIPSWRGLMDAMQQCQAEQDSAADAEPEIDSFAALQRHFARARGEVDDE